MSPIEYVAGRVDERGVDWVVLQVGGFGLRLNVPVATAAALALGVEAKLWAHLYVREDIRALYAFAAPDERGLFLQLLAVNGVGPKMALAALSLLGVDRLARAIESGDEAALARIPGVGRKTASRIVIDLRGKVHAPLVANEPAAGDTWVLDALIGMGLSRGEAADALAAVPPAAGRSDEEALLLALRAHGTRGAAPR